MREDYNRIQSSELFERSKCKEVSGWFEQVPHGSNNLYVWIFGSSVYRQCSSVVFDDVKNAFDKIEFVDESGDPICFNEEGKHCYFVPFLSDNVESQLLTLLNGYDQMSPTEQDSMFFTGKVFNTSGVTFREDIWSSRLVGCLRTVTKQQFTVYNTTSKGNVFSNEFCQHMRLADEAATLLKRAHLFHGSPDITIKKHDHEEIAHVVMQQSEDDGNGSDSDSSEKALIEVPLSEFGPKIGELFSSMHICLMQKAVRHCLALRDGDSAKRRILIKGMVLGRTTGATLRSLEVNLAEEVAVNLKF